MKKTVFFIFFTVLMICISQLMAVAEDTYSYNSDISSMISSKECTNCHNFMSSYYDIMAKTYSWSGSTLSLVSPARPDSSRLIWQIEGMTAGGASLQRMPANGDYYSEAEILIIRNWITQGALEDLPSSVDNTLSWIEIKSKFK